MKYFIPQVVVVEGKTDTAKLKSLFEVDTIETSGTYLSEATINLIKMVNKTRGIILCLDPDTPGENIRKRLEQHLGKFKEVFVKKPITWQKKVGVAETDKQELIDAFKRVISVDTSLKTLEWEQYLSLKLDTQEKREDLAKKLHVSARSNKRLYRILNMLGINYETVKEILSE